jgi:hypothetical protein
VQNARWEPEKDKINKNKFQQIHGHNDWLMEIFALITRSCVFGGGAGIHHSS